MQRFALLMILAAVPLLCASVLTQSSNTSVDGTLRASLGAGNFESAKQCFQGQWFSTSDVAEESSCTMSGFLASVEPVRAVAKQRSIAGQSKSIHGLIIAAHLQPVYEKLADPQLVKSIRSDVARLYFLRPAGQPLNPPDRQKVTAQSEFARAWKQSAEAAEIYSAARTESAASFRATVAAHARGGMRPPNYYQRDGDSENNCLISEEDARPEQQYQGIVAGGLVRAGMKDSLAPEKLNALEVETLRAMESSQLWSEATPEAVKSTASKVKKSLAVK
jgi:hypothetical protein